ncbi:permease prefix domain 1-containing protein [Falsibacillus pallidus]|uniref:permease prefix domain 1-containing protein n=1 Tax=Falsibacillus pallidus TaxID=493781 RepID=UPI003D95E332
MKQIDLFVDAVYHQASGNRKEIQELKTEMKAHLLEAVDELKRGGMAEEEAVKTAIERFGGEDEMRSVVSQLFKAQRVFAKWILYVAISVLCLSAITFSFLLKEENDHMDDQSMIAADIARIIEGKKSITNEMQAAIQDKINDSENISEVAIYPDKSFNAESGGILKGETPVYQYERQVWTPKWLFAESYPYGNGDEQWFVMMQTRTFDKLAVLVSFVGGAMWWTLFAIWAIVNAYHQKRLNAGWVLAFALLNVVGYLIYYLTGKIKFVKHFNA